MRMPSTLAVGHTGSYRVSTVAGGTPVVIPPQGAGLIVGVKNEDGAENDGHGGVEPIPARAETAP